MFAVVRTGGKQYNVAENDVITVEKLDAPVGEKIKLDVLLISDNGSEEEFKYKLTPEEKELFRERMNAVCLKCGADLDECRQEYLQEQAESQSPMMQM